MNLSITIDVEKDLGMVDSYIGLDEGLIPILEILNTFNIRATFFISGEILEYLIKKNYFSKILEGNHEIASHGYYHVDYRNIPESDVKNMILKSKIILEKFSNQKIIGFRAPQFRIDEKIIKILKEIGFKYDSSVTDPDGFSAATLLRGVKKGKDLLKRINEYNFNEFYISSIPQIKCPHGLFWINIIGLFVYKNLFKKFDTNKIKIFYLHPFDVVKEKNRLKYPSLFQKFCYNIKGNRLLTLFYELINFWKNNNVNFVTLKEYYHSLI